MEIHTREMQVTNVAAINPDKVRVTLSDIPDKGTGAGAGLAGGAPMGGAGFTYEVGKDEQPKLWDVQTISVNAA